MQTVFALRLNRPMFASYTQPVAEPETDLFGGWLADSQLYLQHMLQGRQPNSTSLTIGGPCDILSLPQSFGVSFAAGEPVSSIYLFDSSQTLARSSESARK
ncbi:unnamed protein product [Schistocephalus solidus]|uniref:LAM_G_DOMAIN domain-containing protein n=1 Tax=Schistocephalus solidus TaxID=70667 RepID=A0A183T9D3_SCHSO|nr:unnamed protein product [Schistocephalus solidus]